VEFSDYLRMFLGQGSSGSTIRILGIDMVELFGEDVSGVTEMYLPLLRERDISMKILLVDPTSDIPRLKRNAENTLCVNGKMKYESNHLERIYRKIISSCRILAGYKQSCPDRIYCQFINQLPLFSGVLRDGRAVCTVHSNCHKGWDSPIFIIEPPESAMYSFLIEYFDHLWEQAGKTEMISTNLDRAVVEPLHAEFRSLFPFPIDNYDNRG
jgi:hypothetical protein